MNLFLGLTIILLLGGGGNTPVGWCRRGWDSHVTLIRRGGGSGTDVPVGGRQIHSDDRDHGLWVDTGSFTSLGGSLGLLGLGEGRGRLLCLDDEGPDPLLGGGGGDDKTEPDGEDDPERDRGSRQPSWDSNSRVEASHPVRPLPGRK